jgi:Iron-sulfur cluster-binding domain
LTQIIPERIAAATRCARDRSVVHSPPPRPYSVPQMLAVLKDKDTAPVVQANAVEVLGSFFSPETPDSSYARGIYWPDKESVRKACRVPDFYSLIEPDGRVLPCCQVEISHQGEVGNVSGTPLGEVWSGEEFERFRRDRIPFCLQCSAPRNRTLGLVPHMCRQFRD